MDTATYRRLEAYMLEHSSMGDPAHDSLHIYRVLGAALEIAGELEGEGEPVDRDVLVAACLLHDVGRPAQAKDLSLCHAAIGADMAYGYLRGLGWPGEKARHVSDCVGTHRSRGDNQPQTPEAKILFDADKLDITGAIGIARILQYGGMLGEPLYILDEEDRIRTDPTGAEISSFFQEYEYKLRHIQDAFHTAPAKRMAGERRQAAQAFRDALYRELAACHRCHAACGPCGSQAHREA